MYIHDITLCISLFFNSHTLFTVVAKCALYRNNNTAHCIDTVTVITIIYLIVSCQSQPNGHTCHYHLQNTNMASPLTVLFIWTLTHGY